MKNFDKIFSLKIIKVEMKDNNGNNTLSSSSSSKHRSEKIKCNSKSDDDLIDMDADNEAALNRTEEAKLAEEAYLANLKLLKKQKAKFLRLQRILSRNVILIPLCAFFSILSAVTIFSATLTDNYELISYDIDFLRRQIEHENNKTVLEFNAKTSLNLTVEDFLSYKKIFDLEAESNAAALGLEANSYNNNDNSNINQYISELVMKNRLVASVALVKERLQSTFIYELTHIVANDYYTVKRHAYYTNDNTSFKVNYLYETHSGVWKFCNQLSSEIRPSVIFAAQPVMFLRLLFVFKDESRVKLNVEECTFYKRANIEFDDIVERQETELSDPGRDLVSK
jgi:hypothetical protein